MIDTCDLDQILAHTAPHWEALRGERIFITGGTGFVGSWLLASFAKANRDYNLGARAVVLTRDSAAATARFVELGIDSELDLHEGDGSNFAFPPGKFSFMIHAATQRAFAPTENRPLGVIEPDGAMTRRMLDFARHAGTRRFLFTSSGSIYGRQPHDLQSVNEDFTGAPLPTDTEATYAHSKRHSEVVCAMCANSYEITIPIARLFAFVGPLLPLDEGYAVGNFIADALADRTIRIGGDGTPARSYLYAADLAIWLWTILFAGLSGRAYNVGGNEVLTIAELARLVASVSGSKSRIEIAHGAPISTAHSRYVPDTLRAQHELGLRAHIPVAEAIQRTFFWHRERLTRASRSLCRQ